MDCVSVKKLNLFLEISRFLNIQVYWFLKT